MTSRRKFLLNSARSAAFLGVAATGAELPGFAEERKPGAVPTYGDAAKSTRFPVPVDESHSPLRPHLLRFDADHELLQRYYSVPFAPDARARMREFYQLWQKQLAAIDFSGINQDGRVDYLLLRNYLQHRLRQLDLDATFQQQVDVYLPFAPQILALFDDMRAMKPIDSKASAATLAQLTTELKQLPDALSKKYPQPNKEAVNEAVHQLETLEQHLNAWFIFYNGYDPLFTWWVDVPYKSATGALTEYQNYLAVHLLGLAPPPKADGGGGDAYLQSMQSARAGSNKDIIGHAIGRDGIMADLANAMIPYTPEQLIELANHEFAWCTEQMIQASREMGYGDNWRAALEKVKNTYVEPGQQPALVRKLEQQALDFVTSHDLITVPELARDTWRWRMIPPQQQLISPFFLGGEVMQISYPTDTMTYSERMNSMRANNEGMSHATVFHELIPGHELQGFMLERYRNYRSALGETPFFIEGWALYWELLMWDLGFDRTPQEKVGALDWRMLRCGRIIFSLSFHLGKMTPQQCIDLLVNKVGVEPDAAAGEVRRSFSGAYSPLYQAAYLLGGMQIYALHKEMVPAHLTNKQFHDAMLQQYAIPIELIRAAMLDLPLTPSYQPCWKFDGDDLPAVT